MAPWKEVKLPKINETADKVYERIIPALKGDSLIVICPDVEKLPDLDVSTSGQASHIVCTVRPTSVLDGAGFPLEDENVNAQSKFPDASDPTPFAALNSTELHLCFSLRPLKAPTMSSSR